MLRLRSDWVVRQVAWWQNTSGEHKYNPTTLLTISEWINGVMSNTLKVKTQCHICFKAGEARWRWTRSFSLSNKKPSKADCKQVDKTGTFDPCQQSLSFQLINSLLIPPMSFYILISSKEVPEAPRPRTYDSRGPSILVRHAVCAAEVFEKEVELILCRLVGKLVKTLLGGRRGLQRERRTHQ